MLQIEEHDKPSYAPRTWVNAQGADLTAAFAVDHTTAGERLTRKAAGDRFVAFDLDLPPLEAARRLYRALCYAKARTLNIAGNGIYTLTRHGWDQTRVDRHLFEVLRPIAENYPLTLIRSGGQSGVDLAGVTAATALEIKALALLPKGYRMRNCRGEDHDHEREDILDMVMAGVERLRGT